MQPLWVKFYSGTNKVQSETEVQSAYGESTNKGVNQHLKDVTQTQQQRLELPVVSLT